MSLPDTVNAPLELADFEQALGELERLVERMEGGTLPLADTLRDYEQGIALYRRCQQALQQAELRVQALTDPREGNRAQPLDGERSEG